jgi:drug/metabolite transporter (DMT)-like permease
MGKTIGGWAFVIGLIIAIIIAIFGTEQTWPVYLLLVLGLIVGLLNVSDKETGHFLIAAIAFLLTFTALGSVAAGIPAIGDNLVVFFNLVNTFIAPAAAVVAFKELFAHAKN